MAAGIWPSLRDDVELIKPANLGQEVCPGQPPSSKVQQLGQEPLFVMKAALLALLPILAGASPVDKRWTASPYVGSITADVFPPTGSELIRHLRSERC
jgi:hypothetical protein